METGLERISISKASLVSCSFPSTLFSCIICIPLDICDLLYWSSFGRTNFLPYRDNYLSSAKSFLINIGGPNDFAYVGLDVLEVEPATRMNIQVIAYSIFKELYNIRVHELNQARESSGTPLDLSYGVWNFPVGACIKCIFPNLGQGKDDKCLQHI